ncbi:hypothetical protein [Dokdonia sp. Hel_I_53]|uniref:hypothetical protein n=1 Tax=Dokdonia sp. Hel_I_53 TaxID=1566287 RepID=UPI00119AB949|nr:hypothetical protein [Dokdonia sp. Hel_I_53]TVZ52264.1 hypothetical protein OD90_1434 [Dokdonia sp. Hel_I_53]
MKLKKINAGSLQYAITISIIIGGILAAFLLYTHIQLKFSKQSEWANNSIALAEDGLSYVENFNIPYNDTLTLNRDNNGTQDIYKKHWGIYDIIESTGKSHSFNYNFKTLSALTQSKEEILAISMPNEEQSLVLTGATSVYGNVQLSERGAKTGSIAGSYLENEILIHGSELSNYGLIPELNPEKVKHLKDLVSHDFESALEPLRLESSLTHIRSFSEPTAMIYSPKALYIGQEYLEGNIIFISDVSITVSAFAKAKNIILIAPKIKIESNAVVQLQAIASTSISVESEAHLKYPSAIVLINENDQELETPKIIIGQQASIEGSMLYISDIQSKKKLPEILLCKNSKVFGEIYSQGYLELRGKVYGSVYTKNFIVTHKGSSYINHILDGVIDTRTIPVNFGGLMSGKDFKRNHLLWLD